MGLRHPVEWPCHSCQLEKRVQLKFMVCYEMTKCYVEMQLLLWIITSDVAYKDFAMAVSARLPVYTTDFGSADRFVFFNVRSIVIEHSMLQSAAECCSVL